MRIRLDLSYNGKHFFGWAKQPDKRTVQEELEAALSKVLPGMWGKPVPTVVGGRTDTGVHAKGQVVHFDYGVGNRQNGGSDGASSKPHNASSTSTTAAQIQGVPLGGTPILNTVIQSPSPHSNSTTQASKNVTPPTQNVNNFDCEQLLYRLSCVLPEDIVVHQAQVVHPEFSARFWAKQRTYKYRICDGLQHKNPLRTDDVFYARHPLDVRKMNKAIKGFTGVHDFAAFVKPRKGATSTRDLQYFKFKRVRFGADKGLVIVTLKADAFAYNMVRSLVGAAVLVGQGLRDVSWMRQCLESKERQGATGPIAAKGLTLESIEYEKNPRRALKRMGEIRQRR